MPSKEYMSAYYDNPVNKKLRTLNTAYHRYMKKGKYEKAAEVQKQMDELKVLKAKQKAEVFEQNILAKYK